MTQKIVYFVVDIDDTLIHYTPVFLHFLQQKYPQSVVLKHWKGSLPWGTLYNDVVQGVGGHVDDLKELVEQADEHTNNYPMLILDNIKTIGDRIAAKRAQGHTVRLSFVTARKGHHLKPELQQVLRRIATLWGFSIYTTYTEHPSGSKRVLAWMERRLGRIYDGGDFEVISYDDNEEVRNGLNAASEYVNTVLRTYWHYQACWVPYGRGETTINSW